MTGDREILAMRYAGMKPEFVWVSDFPHSFLDGFTVRVAGDVPELLDLRFLVGVTAFVEGESAERVDRLVAACSGIARRVIGNTLSRATGWWEIVRTTDTDGVLTWPA